MEQVVPAPAGQEPWDGAVHVIGNENDVELERWWEVPLAFLLLPLTLPLLLLIAILSIPGMWIAQRISNHQEKKLTASLKNVGRFVDWTDVESKLVSGEGTLIVEYYLPKGPVREWWTQDDVIGDAPKALPESIELDDDRWTDRHADYARSCVVRYINLDYGNAAITDPPRMLRSASDRKLHERYPQGRVVTLLNFAGVWQIAEGDMKLREEPDAERDGE